MGTAAVLVVVAVAEAVVLAALDKDRVFLAESEVKRTKKKKELKMC